MNTRTEGPNARGIILLFSVRDTGIGIPADKQRNIFDAFSQADSSTTRKYGGTGLGLTIAGQLVRLMGGKLWVQSEAGKGSTFCFTVQVGPGDRISAESRAKTLDISPFIGVPVLVVDDNATNRRILEDSLLRWKMVPTVVDSAAAAIEALRRAQESGSPLPLLLTDAHMPEMDGFGLVERIRQDPSLNNIKIVVLTSGGGRGDAALCRKLGVDAYLSKPFDRLELRDLLLRVLAGRLSEGGKQTFGHSAYSPGPGEIASFPCCRRQCGQPKTDCPSAGEAGAHCGGGAEWTRSSGIIGATALRYCSHGRT